MKKEWNSNDWQGRKLRQVETNYKILDLIYSLMCIAFCTWVIYNIVINSVS